MIAIQTITAKPSTATPRDWTFSIGVEQKMPRARKELAKASKAPNKSRRPCCEKMSLKRKREKPKRPPATMSRTLNGFAKTTTECSQAGEFVKCSSKAWTVTSAIPVNSVLTDIHERRPRRRPGKKTNAQSQRKNNPL